MAAGSIVIDLLMKTGAFSTDVKRAEKEIKQLGESIKNYAQVAGVATAAVVAGFAYMAKQSIDAMDQMDEMAQSLGLSVEQISRLGNVARVEGMSLEDFGGTMAKLTKSIADARSGAEGAGDVFKALGLDPAAFKDSEDALLKISDAMSQYNDGLEKTAISQEIFGKSGYKFIAFLNQGSEGINKVANDLALFSSANSEAAALAGQFNDNLTKMGIVAESVIQKFTIGFLPALNNFAQGLFDAYLQADGMREEMNKLVSVDMVRWAENIAIALAHIVDAGVFVVRAMMAIGQSIRVVLADVNLIYQAAQLGRKPTGEDVTNFRNALNERNSILAIANQSYEDLVNKNAAFFTQTTKDAVELARLSRLLPNDEDFGVSPEVKRNAPVLTKTDKGAQKELEKMQNMLAEAKKLGAEYEREREHSLEMLKIREDLAGMTENERKVQLAVNEVLDATSKALQQIADKREAAAGRGANAEVLAEYDAQMEKVKELGREYVNLARTQEQSSIDAQNTFSYGWNKALAQYAENSRNYSQKAADMFESVTGNMNSAIANFVDTGKFSFADFTSSVLKDLLRIELQMRAMILFRAAASAIGSALFPSSGAVANGPGTTAGGEGAIAFPVFADGGYTGDGGKYDPAGLVHKGEYVLNARATQRIGVAKLDALNGYADGGYVGTQPPANMNEPSVVINLVNQSRQPLQAEQSQPRFDGQKFVQDIILSDLRRNGPIAQGIRG